MLSIHHILWYIPCLFQEGLNVIHVNVLEQVTERIYPEESLSDESERCTFYENVFNGERRLTCQTLLLFLFGYKRVSKPCVTDTQSGYNDLFSSWFSESWSPFSQSGLDLEEFILDVIIPALFAWRNLLILGFRSVYGILKFSRVWS